MTEKQLLMSNWIKDMDNRSQPPKSKPISSDQLVALIDFITDRFYGATVDGKMLQNAISDWKREQAA